MTDTSKIELKYLATVDLAPSTPQAEHIRAAEAVSLPAVWEGARLISEYRLIEADLIDEQHFLARLKYEDLVGSALESLAPVIVQRATAELLFQLECAQFSGSSSEEEIAQLEARLAAIRSGTASEVVARSPVLCLSEARIFTERQVKNLEQQLHAVSEQKRAQNPSESHGVGPRDLIDPYEDEFWMDLMDDPFFRMGETALKVWVSDELVRTKHRGHFRQYLRTEHNVI